MDEGTGMSIQRKKKRSEIIPTGIGLGNPILEKYS